MLVYPSGIDLSSQTLRFLSGLLTARRRERGTRWRRLTADRQALLVLAYLRCGHTYAQLAAGCGVKIATVYRYIREGVEVLAALAPDVFDAVRPAARKAFVILDGTLLPIDRIAADRPYYSGKHKKHGMNVQVIADPFGRLVRASPALPGAVHDPKAARTHKIIRLSPRPACLAGPTRATRAPAAPSASPTAAAGRTCRQASRPSTPPTPRSAHVVNKPWPPSRPGGSCGS
ncbi:hypothetical protein GCM10009549_24400 [Streptomyces thermoalcalitolerans]|uniref:DDE superfamily endonuclease n=1 Tax=Streptomyces thermoalcalitolerans TaxID=65605 RepID=A0ABP3Z0G2_9ACTN